MCKVFCLRIHPGIMCVPGTCGFYFHAWPVPVEYSTSYNNLGKSVWFSTWFVLASCLLLLPLFQYGCRLTFQILSSLISAIIHKKVTFFKHQVLTWSFLYLQSFLFFPQANKHNCVYPENACSLTQLFPESLDCLSLCSLLWLVLTKGSCVGGLVHNGMVLKSSRTWECSSAGKMLASHIWSPGFEP